MTELIIFDVDGTLTRTLDVDTSCFLRAFEESFGWTGIDDDWSSYPEYADSSIAHEIFLRRLGRPPTPEETGRVISAFLRLMEDAWREDPSRFGSIAGAPAAVERLRRDPSRRLAVATGCWKASALFKLEKAGIDLDSVPMSTSDRTIIRREIVSRALAEARQFYRPAAFDRLVFIGDGVWDVKVSRLLGLCFLGVGAGEAKRSLQAAGAGPVIPDYADYGLFLRALAEAAVPGDKAACARSATKRNYGA